MASTLDVGQYITSELGWTGVRRLETLTYYAQVWHLVWDGRPLVEDGFRAEEQGPVPARLHAALERLGGTPPSDGLPGADPYALDERSRMIVDAILEFYGAMSGEALASTAHSDVQSVLARGSSPDADDDAEADSVDRPLDGGAIRRHHTAQSLEGGDGPRRPPVSGTVVPETREGRQACAEIARGEIARWGEALTLLEDR